MDSRLLPYETASDVLGSCSDALTAAGFGPTPFKFNGVEDFINF